MTQEQDQVAELRNATERLVEQVGALSVALQTVNHLQQRQLETDRKVQAAVDTAASTKTEVAQSFEDLEMRTTIARALTQRKLRWFAIGTACMALVVALLAIWFVHLVDQHEVKGLHNQRLALCGQRNIDAESAAANTRQYFAPKLAQERANPHADPVLISILQALADTKAVMVKCT